MLKLLRVKATGFRSLEDGFEINLLNRSRVSDVDSAPQILEIDENLYGFKTAAIIGNNSSGKSSILALLCGVLAFLKFGRCQFPLSDFGKDTIKLEIDFYLEGKIYFYDGTIAKPAPEFDGYMDFGEILEESLSSLPYAPYMGRKALAKKANAKKVELRPCCIDCSGMRDISKGHIDFVRFDTNVAGTKFIDDSFYDYLEKADGKVRKALLALLDDSIQHIEKFEDRVKLVKKGEAPIIIRKKELPSYVSTGTIRGLELFLRVYRILDSGGVLFVDEIDNSLHAELVRNVLSLFKSYRANINGAQLVFTTHSFDTIDLLDRKDSVFIAHRDGNAVKMANLKDGYEIRSDLLLSHQLDGGDYGTDVDYDRMMDARRTITDGVRSASVRGV